MKVSLQGRRLFESSCFFTLHTGDKWEGWTWTVRLEAIASKFEATIPIGLEAIPIRLEAIALRLEAIFCATFAREPGLKVLTKEGRSCEAKSLGSIQPTSDGLQPKGAGLQWEGIPAQNGSLKRIHSSQLRSP